MNPSSSHLGPAQLARLLAIAEEDKAPAGAREAPAWPAEALADLLAQPWPPREALGPASRKGMDFPTAEPGAPAVQTLGEVLTSRRSSVEVLKAIQAHGKALARTAEDPAWREAGRGIYYAAIAAALVYHGVRISRLSAEALRKAFVTWSGAAWVPMTLAALFERAGARCPEQAGERE